MLTLRRAREFRRGDMISISHATHRAEKCSISCFSAAPQLNYLIIIAGLNGAELFRLRYIEELSLTGLVAARVFRDLASMRQFRLLGS